MSAVIVNYNGGDMLRRCIAALRDGAGNTQLEIIVVDNGSQDNSLRQLDRYSQPDKLIRSGRNQGFAKANNIGAEIAHGKNLLFVNTDCFVTDTLIAGLRTALEENWHNGAAGPRLLNPDGSLQRSCHDFPGPLTFFLEQSNLWRLLKWIPGHLGLTYAGSHLTRKPVDWLLGACLMVKADAFNSVGGFSERFFFYWEEADLLMRMRDIGLDTIFVPSVQAVHIGGGSSAGQSYRMRELFYRGLYLFCSRHYTTVRITSIRVTARALALARLCKSLATLLARKTSRAESLRDARSWWRIARL